MTATPSATTSHTGKWGRAKYSVHHCNLQRIQPSMLPSLQCCICLHFFNSMATHSHTHQPLHATRDNLIPAQTS